MGFRSKFKRLTAFAVGLVVLLSVAAVPVVAESSAAYDDVPYKSYTYWQGYSQKSAIGMKDVYAVSQTIDGTSLSGSAFARIQHMCIDADGMIYLLDSEKSEITVLDCEYKYVRNITFVKDGQTFDFKGARGIFVSDSGRIFVADTVNNRVLVAESDGNVTYVLSNPKSQLIPDDVVFMPMRVIEDEQGYIYVLSDGCFYGAMKFDKDFNFVGFYGANKVAATVLSAIENVIDTLFSTEQKRMNDVQKIPYTFLDFCIDKQGFILTTTSNWQTKSGQVRRLSPAGNNILKHHFNYKTTSGDSFNFGDVGAVTSESNKGTVNMFSSITADKNFFYALDTATGRVFVYDFNCNLITVFSGGFGSGNQAGVFKTATAIVVADNGDVLVSDGERHIVTIFKTTTYGNTFKKAAILSAQGKYLQAQPLFKEVNAADKNNQMAYIGLGKAALMQEDYETASDFARTGLDQETYAAAHKQMMNSKLKSNFGWLFFGAIIVLGLLTAFIVISSKRNIVLIKNQTVNTACSVLVHPFDRFNRIKEKNEGSVIIATVLLILFFIGRTCGDIYSGFMYKVPDTDNYNVLYTFLGTIVLVLLWVGVNWATSVLFEGKGHLKQIYIVSCYALIPLIIHSFVYLVLTHFVAPSTVSFVTAFSTVCIIYFIFMMLIAVMTVHEFSFVKTLLISAFTVVGMAIVGFLIFMTLTLCQDFVGFIASIYQEVALR